MADADRRQTPALSPDSTLPSIKEDLLQKTPAYAFFQAVRLLRYFAGREGMQDELRFLNDTLRVRPALSLAFPGTDMTDMQELCTEDECIRYRITATFLGLYGSSSPLPTFYTEELLDDASDDVSVVRDFIDIVNTPLYPLLIRAWTKYRLLIKLVEEHDQDYLERLFCLCGLGLPELRNRIMRPIRLLRYIGLFSQWPRSALGLQTLLSDSLGGVPVDVEPCTLQKVRIPDDQRFSLGQENNCLGEDAVVGELVEDRLGRITVRIGPMSAEDYHQCLPGSDRYEWIVQLIRLYLVQPLSCNLQLVMRPAEAQNAQLGGTTWSALGLDTWVFSTLQPERAEAPFQIEEFTL